MSSQVAEDTAAISDDVDGFNSAISPSRHGQQQQQPDENKKYSYVKDIYEVFYVRGIYIPYNDMTIFDHIEVAEYPDDPLILYRLTYSFLIIGMYLRLHIMPLLCSSIGLFYHY